MPQPQRMAFNLLTRSPVTAWYNLSLPCFAVLHRNTANYQEKKKTQLVTLTPLTPYKCNSNFSQLNLIFLAYEMINTYVTNGV